MYIYYVQQHTLLPGRSPNGHAIPGSGLLLGLGGLDVISVIIQTFMTCGVCIFFLTSLSPGLEIKSRGNISLAEREIDSDTQLCAEYIMPQHQPALCCCTTKTFVS